MSAIVCGIIASDGARTLIERRFGVPKTRKRPVLSGITTWSSGSLNPVAPPLGANTPTTSKATPAIRICWPTMASGVAAPRLVAVVAPSTATRLRPSSSPCVNMRPAASV